MATDDFGSVIFRMGERARGAMTASQVSAGCKNRLCIEVFGSKSSVAWNQERPDELWMGNRNAPNQVLIKDPSLLLPAARTYADLPGGHSEGYDDTFKQVFRRFYASFEEPAHGARISPVPRRPAADDHSRCRPGEPPDARLGRASRRRISTDLETR